MFTNVDLGPRKEIQRTNNSIFPDSVAVRSVWKGAKLSPDTCVASMFLVLLHMAACEINYPKLECQSFSPMAVGVLGLELRTIHEFSLYHEKATLS